jgi:hypothetical protein
MAQQPAGPIRDLAVPAAKEPRRRLKPPSIPAAVFVVIALVVPLLLQRPLLNSDGDLARHLRHGRYMLEHGELIRRDPFSFTRAGRPFVGFEYGSQLCYALAERLGGLPGVAILAGLLIGLTYALLTRFLLRAGVDPLLAYLTVALAVVLGLGHWTARPHLFSFVATIVVVGLLERPGSRSFLFCTALFALWANLHGGFVYGWILISAYLAGALAELWRGAGGLKWKRRLQAYVAMLGGAVIGTVINPYGLNLHRHLLRFFRQPFLVDNTVEFASPNFHEPGAKLFLVILLAAIGSLILKEHRPSYPRLFVIGICVAFSLMALRNIPLFGLVALPLIALELDPSWRGLPDPGGFRSRFALMARQTTTLPWVLPTVLLLSSLALARGRVGSVQLIREQFDPSVFPVAAVAQARSAGLQGHLFSDLAWGGYVVYAWPEQRVFIDGGTDFFGEELFRDYARIKGLSPGWRDILERYRISVILLEREQTLTHELARDGRWALWYCDSLAVVLQRTDLQARIDPSAADSAEHALDRCGVRRSDSLSDREEGKTPGE